MYEMYRVFKRFIEDAYYEENDAWIPKYFQTKKKKVYLLFFHRLFPLYLHYPKEVKWIRVSGQLPHLYLVLCRHKEQEETDVPLRFTETVLKSLSQDWRQVVPSVLSRKQSPSCSKRVLSGTGSQTETHLHKIRATHRCMVQERPLTWKLPLGVKHLAQG